MALVDRTAYPRLPRSVAARELAEVFTPTGEEVSWARAKTTTDQHCLTLLVLLKCYQRLGYFPRPEQIPAEIAEHVRGCAELTSAGSVIDDDSPRLVKRYREFIREWVGVVWEPPRVRAVAESAMREALLGKDNPADVINVALERLAQQRCELPAYSTLDRLAAKIRTEVNGGFHRLVAARLDAGARARLLELLIVDPLSRRSRPSAPERVLSRKVGCCPWSAVHERRLQGLVVPQISAQVQRLDLRERATLRLRTRSGALGLGQPAER